MASDSFGSPPKGPADLAVERLIAAALRPKHTQRTTSTAIDWDFVDLLEAADKPPEVYRFIRLQETQVLPLMPPSLGTTLLITSIFWDRHRIGFWDDLDDLVRHARTSAAAERDSAEATRFESLVRRALAERDFSQGNVKAAEDSLKWLISSGLPAHRGEAHTLKGLIALAAGRADNAVAALDASLANAEDPDDPYSTISDRLVSRLESEHPYDPRIVEGRRRFDKLTLERKLTHRPRIPSTGR